MSQQGLILQAVSAQETGSSAAAWVCDSAQDCAADLAGCLHFRMGKRVSVLSDHLLHRGGNNYRYLCLKPHRPSVKASRAASSSDPAVSPKAMVLHSLGSRFKWSPET